MPVKKTAQKVKKTKITKQSKEVAIPSQQQSTFKNFAEYLRLGESYTSLVLGIVVVIIATVLLLSFVHNRQSSNQTPEVTPTIVENNTFGITPSPTSLPKAKAGITEKSYTVVAGDNLWSIAEKVYHNGYNWVDIARLNKLSDPSDIHVGNKLALPQVTSLPDATVLTNDEHLSSTKANQLGRITATSYVIVRDDTLWSIAVRAYGDGYQWVKIANANNITNTDIIHAGNTLKLPRN